MDEARRSPIKLVGTILVWALTILVTLGMGMAGFVKFGAAGGEMWAGMFEGWGYPNGFVYLIGALELGGALMLLIPRFASYAAGLLIVVMLGALATVVIHDDPLGVTGPIIFFVALTILLLARWGRRWQPSGGSA